jgi:uncharacterized membrane protein
MLTSQTKYIVIIHVSMLITHKNETRHLQVNLMETNTSVYISMFSVIHRAYIHVFFNRHMRSLILLLLLTQYYGWINFIWHSIYCVLLQTFFSFTKSTVLPFLETRSKARGIHLVNQIRAAWGQQAWSPGPPSELLLVGFSFESQFWVIDV